MNITSLIVEGAGRFGTRVSLQGLGDGVNILAAGNEAGKSTLFRAIRICVFERHTTSNRAVASLCTEGLSLPLSVQLGFRHAEHDYVVAKNFIRSPSASLRRDGVEIARGRQADEIIWELLGIEPGSGRSVDEAAFGLLWVTQGHSFRRPDISGAAANTLNAIIHQEVGTLVGGERARAVLDTIDAELDRQLTAGGKPKAGGSLGRAIASVERLKEELAAVQERLGRADNQITSYESLTKERESLSDVATVAQMKADSAAAEVALKAAETALGQLKGARSSEQQAAAIMQNALREAADLKSLADRIDRNEVREQELLDQLSPLRHRSSENERRRTEARTQLDSTRLQSRADESAERRVRQLLVAASGIERRSFLLARQGQLTELARRIAPIEAELSVNTATAELISSLDQIEREIATLEARLEASAAHVKVIPERHGTAIVDIDGEPLEGDTTRSVIKRVVVTVSQAAVIEVSPSLRYGRAETERRDILDQQLSTLVSEASVSTVEQVRSAYFRRSQLEREQTAVHAELKALNVERNSLAREIESTDGALVALQDGLSSALRIAERAEMPDRETLEFELAAIAMRLEQTRRDQERLVGLIDAQNALSEETATAIARLDGELQEVRRGHEIDLALLPDDRRTELLAAAQSKAEEARQAHRVCAAALQKAQAEAPDEVELQRLQTRCDRLHRAVEGQRDKVGSLEREIARLEGLIAAAGADGLGDRAAALSDEVDLCTREAERLQARAEALKLLRDTVDRCYRQQREQLNAPLLRHLQPFLNDVFPSAAPEIGDDFSVTALRRGGALSERFDLLSDGTQEQIAVLVRLALGSMICGRAEPVPVILDDALVFSDDDRIQRMFDALDRAGRCQQVIVLTCRTKAFASLGGRELSLACG